ncbi:MAG: hypothetical protein ACE5MI_10160 [Acidimicrobiia bacterium]
MSKKEFTAIATTCEIDPGSEEMDGATLRIRNRVFTDIVESDDPRLAGVNKPTLNLDLDPASGQGTLEGEFVLTPQAVEGTWEGSLTGSLEGGLVRARGQASGTGILQGFDLHVEYEQIKEHPGQPPCEDPQAFFQMWGHVG